MNDPGAALIRRSSLVLFLLAGLPVSLDAAAKTAAPALTAEVAVTLVRYPSRYGGATRWYWV